MLRTALGAALALCLATGCSDGDLAGGAADGGPKPPGETAAASQPGQPGPPPAHEARDGLVRGGQVHRVDLSPLGAGADHALLLGAVEGELRSWIGPLDAEDFQVRGDVSSQAGGGARLRHLDLVQQVNGVPIHDTYLQLTVREEGGAAGGSTLVGSAFRVVQRPGVDTRAAVDGAAAAARARESLRLAGAPVTRQELIVRELGGRLELVWQLALRGSSRRALVIAGGPNAGQVIQVDEGVYETTGTASGFFVNGGAPGGAGILAQAGLAHLDVTAPSGSTRTDTAGNFTLDVPAGETISAALSGRAALVLDFAGSPVSASGPAGATLDLVLASATSGEGALAQVTTYVAAGQTRAFLEANGVPGLILGGPLKAHTNLNDSCNAFYNSFEPSINFLRSGGGCHNSATDSLVTHEYGHFADDVLGGITSEGLSEGWGDLLSCYRLGVPEVGFDLFPGQALRSCANDYVFPPGGVDEAHTLGQAWMGFAWRVRQGLIAKRGAIEGEELARQLVLPSLVSNAADIPAAVRETFLRDDDDGNLANQTPDWDVLLPAAAHHGLDFVVVPDVTPPAAVTDLVARFSSVSSVTLVWTAPGDDGNQGTAASYEIRIGPAPITPANFTSFGKVVEPPPSPSPAGTRQSMQATMLPERTLFVALVARDDRFNTSALSNVVQVTMPFGPTPALHHEGAEGGLGGYTATGLWHVTATRAFLGSRSFWYGQEATGNYDTGSANAGALTSPVIDLREATAPIILSFAQLIDVEDAPGFDRLTVTVTDADAAANTVSFAKQSGSTGGAFAFRVLPLDGFAGRRVRLAFSFNTVDGALNRTAGWLVDDIRVHGQLLSADPFEVSDEFRARMDQVQAECQCFTSLTPWIVDPVSPAAQVFISDNLLEVISQDSQLGWGSQGAIDSGQLDDLLGSSAGFVDEIAAVADPGGGTSVLGARHWSRETAPDFCSGETLFLLYFPNTGILFVFRFDSSHEC